MKKTIQISNLDSLDVVLRECREFLEQNGPGEIEIRKQSSKKRSLPQNASLHLYTSVMSEKMNGAGITQKSLVGSFKDGFELPVTSHMIKDIFREVGKAMYKKESTAKLTTVEMIEVYKVVDERFSQVTGVSSPWPSRQEQMMREYK